MCNTRKLLYLLIAVCFAIPSFAQTPQNLKYNLKTRQIEEGKKIPFDVPFTLTVDSLSGKNVRGVAIFKAEVKQGERDLHYESVLGCDGNTRSLAVPDKILEFRKGAEQLIIDIPALKPNSEFDIHVYYLLIPQHRSLLHKVNLKLAQGESGQSVYTDFVAALIDEKTKTSYLSLDYSQYAAFYDSDLKQMFNDITVYADSHKPFLTRDELLGIGMLTDQKAANFNQIRLLISIIEEGKDSQLQHGLIDVMKYGSDVSPLVKADWQGRVNNLSSNIRYFQTLLEATDNAIMIGKPVKVNGNDVDLNAVRKKLRLLIAEVLIPNYKYLEDQGKVINAAIDANEAISSGFYLSGNTIASDLKTAGGSVLFLDAGLTNILAPGVNNQWVYIPRLYYGVSIYFRPIDKNTRTNSFPYKHKLKIDKNCHTDPVTGKKVHGPDYDVISTWDWRQHVSLNIGFTFGGIPNADFDNFYNNSSLLVGPAFRFKRAFKVSLGASFLKRSSQNPLVSEKKVVVGSYASLSVDIDFIQGLSQVTSFLFK